MQDTGEATQEGCEGVGIDKKGKVDGKRRQGGAKEVGHRGEGHHGGGQRSSKHGAAHSCSTQ